MTRRAHAPGDVIGCARVVEYTGGGRIRVECTDCGARREIYATALAPRASRWAHRCRACKGRSLAAGTPGVCRWCGGYAHRRGVPKTRCVTCERRRCRNGVCACGRPRYATRACPGCEKPPPSLSD